MYGDLKATQTSVYMNNIHKKEDQMHIPGSELTKQKQCHNNWKAYLT